MEVSQIIEKIRQAKNPVFLTGAGVSTASGIPDYRSMTGVYTTSGLKRPEYLLSHRALIYDTEAWYTFMKQLYHKDARPNVIHEGIAQTQAPVITQNIDGLHLAAGSTDVVEFHGSIERHHCERCDKPVSTEEFLESYIHKNCGGLVRPDVIFYDERVALNSYSRSIEILKNADAVFLVGTTFQVFPFAGLTAYVRPAVDIYAINRTPISVVRPNRTCLGDARKVFQKLLEG